MTRLLLLGAVLLMGWPALSGQDLFSTPEEEYKPTAPVMAQAQARSDR